jgi:hypothetical protein
MPFILKMRSFLRNLIFRSHVDTDHDSVVEAHFGLLTEEYIRKGLTPDEAERAARIELGGSGTDQRASPRTAPWELAFLGIRRLPLCTAPTPTVSWLHRRCNPYPRPRHRRQYCHLWRRRGRCVGSLAIPAARTVGLFNGEKSRKQTDDGQLLS